MFKKTLLALAVTALAGTANAATFTAAASKNVSIEGNATTANASKIQAADLNGVVLDTGSDYIINDLVVFKVAGATFDTTVTGITATGTTATFTFVDYSDSNTVRFRVSGANHPKAEDITLDDYVLKSGTPSNNQKVTFTANAISVNPLIGNYDATTAGLDIAKFVNQASFAVTELNGEVSTSKGRAQFTADAPDDKKDVLTLTLTDDSAAVDALTVDKITHVIKGNFSYLMDYDLAANGGNANGKLDTAEINAAIVPAGAGATFATTVSSTLDTVTINQTVAFPAAVTVDFNVVGNAAGGSVLVAPQSFTVDSTFADGTDKIVLAQKSAGSWTLDGSLDNIELMPFGSEYAQSITVANTGSVEGAITVTLKANGSTYTKTLDAVAAANTVTNISLEVAAFAAASGITGNAHVNVVVNAPAGNIGVKGVYYHKASADRVLTH